MTQVQEETKKEILEDYFKSYNISQIDENNYSFEINQIKYNIYTKDNIIIKSDDKYNNIEIFLFNNDYVCDSLDTKICTHSVITKSDNNKKRCAIQHTEIYRCFLIVRNEEYEAILDFKTDNIYEEYVQYLLQYDNNFPNILNNMIKNGAELIYIYTNIMKKDIYTKELRKTK